MPSPAGFWLSKSLRLDSFKQILSFSLHIVRGNFLVILLVLWTACNCKFVHGRPELGCSTKYTWKSLFNMPSSPSTSRVESWVLLVPFFILFPLSRELQKPRSHFVTHKRNEAQQNLHLKNNSEHLFTSLILVHYGVDIFQSTLVPDKYELYEWSQIWAGGRHVQLFNISVNFFQAHRNTWAELTPAQHWAAHSEEPRVSMAFPFLAKILLKIKLCFYILLASLLPPFSSSVWWLWFPWDLGSERKVALL